MVQTDAVGGQPVHDGLASGDHRVLQAVALLTYRVTPHQVAVFGAAQIGAPYRVQGGDAPGLDFAVGVLAAAGMEEHGVVAQSNLQIVGTGGADRADGAHPVQGLIDANHSGDAALGGDLIDDVSLRLAQLGEGLLQIVEHDGHRPAVDPLFAHGQAGEWVEGTVIRGLGGCGRNTFHHRGGGSGRRGGVLRFRRPTAGGEQQGQRKQQGQQFFSHDGILRFLAGRPPWGPGLRSVVPLSYSVGQVPVKVAGAGKLHL